MKWIVLLFIPAVMVIGMSGPAHAAGADLQTIDDIKQHAMEGITFLSNDELKARIARNPKLVLLDVRTEKEYQAGHLRGAAWIERGIVEFVLARTLKDSEAEIVVYCKKGYRAGLVVKTLRAAGYRNVHAHAGFDAWVEAGNTYWNLLGESRLIKLNETTAADSAPDYFQPK